MAKLHELQEKRRNIAAQMRTLHDKIGDNAWTDEQRTEWNKMKTELDGVDALISREEELRSMDEKFVKEQEAAEAEKRAQKDGEKTLSVDERRGQAFNAFLRNGLTNLTPEERQALNEMRAQGVGVNDHGGYTVPKEMQARIVEQMKAYGGIASVAQILTTSDGRTIEWITADGTTEEGELIGENTAATEADTSFGIANLGAKKLSSKIIRVSNELLQDSAINIESYLADRIAQRIGRAEAKYLIQGTGAGTPAQPKGLAASVTGTTAAKVAGKVDWLDINALLHSVDPAYRNVGNSRLAFNDNTFKVLKEMVDAQNRPLWLPDVAGVAPSTILGKQYVIDQGIADIAKDAKFLYFGDFNRFVVRRVAYMTLKRLVERYAEFDQTAFLAFHRFDCVLEDTSAIKALIGK
ncbi:phage major capsid protein [Aggregatibacter segnis]|uniref:Phage capsid protein n=1 Tax=Aggregatibacter segnis ATCC 33393 TaxID=888057 RepID=E6KYB7_9PAST|nr:phage major capsid protein [Aggregatibacter segnis]EFU67471.1 phage capsid protein [Aggregatibacter segnis ATCC 33393]QQB09132.1 phage major capsid protein [Aggregatibacter segnis]QQB09171.1 phage major capsid protein [Aggregatibacter segnis]SQH65094.1 Predicted phage phi-C31 gp36 major capsid-like protein [Aggregatibacter segnis ATCC 33393]